MSLSVIPCAFHPEEYITNFCRAQNCLLPMCPKCIKIHAQEHKQTKTFAAFESISLVLKEVQNNCLSIQRMMERCSQQIFDLQEQKKKRQLQIRQKLAQARTRIIREFDRYLNDLQTDLLNKLNHYDQAMVIQFKQIDNIIENRIHKTQEHLNNLSNEKSLKTIINFFSGAYIRESQAEFDLLQNRINDLTKKNVELCVDQTQLFRLGECIKSYIVLNGANPSQLFRSNKHQRDIKQSHDIQHHSNLMQS